MLVYELTARCLSRMLSMTGPLRAAQHIYHGIVCRIQWVLHSVFQADKLVCFILIRSTRSSRSFWGSFHAWIDIWRRGLSAPLSTFMQSKRSPCSWAIIDLVPCRPWLSRGGTDVSWLVVRRIDLSERMFLARTLWTNWAQRLCKCRETWTHCFS